MISSDGTPIDLPENVLDFSTYIADQYEVLGGNIPLVADRTNNIYPTTKNLELIKRYLVIHSGETPEQIADKRKELSEGRANPYIDPRDLELLSPLSARELQYLLLLANYIGMSSIMMPGESKPTSTGLLRAITDVIARDIASKTPEQIRQTYNF